MADSRGLQLGDMGYTNAGSAERSRNVKYILRLYILGRTPLSELAIRNAKALFEDGFKGVHELEVIDLLEHPQVAEDEKIFATPTLEKVHPPPQRRVIGDLSSIATILIGLGIMEEKISETGR